MLLLLLTFVISVSGTCFPPKSEKIAHTENCVCPSGFSSLSGSDNCVPDGVAYDPNYSLNVVACNTLGQYQTADGSACGNCYQGKYLDEFGLRGPAACKSCPDGKFTPNNDIGHSVCEECPSGYDSAGDSCVCGSGNFLEGSYGLVNGASPASSLCPANNMLEISSADMCQTAASYTENGVVHVGSWHSDPKGCWIWKSPLGGSAKAYFNIHPSPVGDGKCDWSGYSNGVNSYYSQGCLCWSRGTSCEPCAVGRYQDQTDQDTCVS